MTCWIAVQTGMRDERGEDVYDPVFRQSDMFDPAHAVPRVGETIKTRNRRYEVVHVAWSLDDNTITFVVKPEE